jgi:NADPH:quinone reductase-like Zn-dependent oxidoreductase
MKAVLVEQPGPPDVLKSVDIPEPAPKRGEAVVRVAAAGMNRIDIWVRSGVYKVSLPRIIGADAAGVVEEVGEDVTSVSRGDRVLVDPAIKCGRCRFCLMGMDSSCENLVLLGHGKDGTYAEKIAVPASNLYPVPSGLEMHEAAAIMVNYMTVWHAAVTRAGLRPGSTVLVVGAGSGVGCGGNTALQAVRMHRHIHGRRRLEGAAGPTGWELTTSLTGRREGGRSGGGADQGKGS